MKRGVVEGVEWRGWRERVVDMGCIGEGVYWREGVLERGCSGEGCSGEGV